MDLLVKVGLIAVILIAIAGVGFYLYNTAVVGGTALTAAQASQIVMRDLKASNPNADVSIINVTPSALRTNSWNIVLSVVYNATKPCPTLFIEAFDYPATGLLPSIDNLYTDKCTIYGLSSAPDYVVSSPTIAIVKSYNNRFFSATGATTLADYISTYGYNNMVVHAAFYGTLGKSMTPFNRTFNNVWLVNYTAAGAQYSEFVMLDSSGNPINIYPIAHTA